MKISEFNAFVINNPDGRIPRRLRMHPNTWRELIGNIPMYPDAKSHYPPTFDGIEVLCDPLCPLDTVYKEYGDSWGRAVRPQSRSW